jgi:type VI secretion system secreted protein VgrG
MPLKQESRSLAISTALGPNVLAVRSISVQEQLSRLFQIQAELCSEDGNIDFDQVVGRNATLRLDLPDRNKRYFNGLVGRLEQLGNQGTYASYRATIVPWLWFLTRTTDCRIFQDKTVPDILEEVFNRHGFSDYSIKLSSSYQAWDYCVQYRETDFNFVSRLMEREGIYYFFEHENDKHTLVLADSISAHNPFPGYAELRFHEVDQAGAPGGEAVTEWTIGKEAQPVACALNDFDFEKPRASLRATANATRRYGRAQYEIYDYPGDYLDFGEGQRLADVRLEELQAQYEELRGQSSARGLASGCTFKLNNHPRNDQNRDYLLTGVSLQYDAGPFEASGDGGDLFSCSFTAIEKSCQFRAPRLTPKPMVQGPQTAIVVGPAGEEIHTDPHARVKVQFHWDRYGKRDENSSCWIRVSQPWAGKRWGSMATPRIGQEVIVEFLEGDPDRPLITGRVYNADQPPPYASGQGVISGMKSKTHKGGGYNEISMDDTAGKEKITIHAQFDMNTTVEHDQTDVVHNHRTRTVDVNDTETVGSNQKITVGSNQTTQIGANRTTQVGGSDSLTVNAAQSTHVGADQTNTIGAAQTNNINAAQTNKVGANQTNNIGGDQDTTVAGSRSATVSGSDTLTASGAVSVSGSKITLSAGGSSIEIGPGGVSISGGVVDIKGGVIKNNA